MKPDDIPQDVWDYAEIALKFVPSGDDSAQIASIALAILAERERCAKVAEAFHEDDDSMDRQIKSDVAAVIRKGDNMAKIYELAEQVFDSFGLDRILNEVQRDQVLHAIGHAIEDERIRCAEVAETCISRTPREGRKTLYKSQEIAVYASDMVAEAIRKGWRP